MRGKHAVLAAAAMAFAAGFSYAEDEPTVDPSALEKLITAIDAEPTVLARHAACPADIYNTDASLWRWIAESAEYDEEECGKSPSSCVDACISDSNENACF